MIIAAPEQRCLGAVFPFSNNPTSQNLMIIWELEISADLLFHCFCAMMITANSKACLLIWR